LFGAEPAKRRPGHANFAIEEPPLKLVLIEGSAGEPTVMDHLGTEPSVDRVVPTAAQPSTYLDSATEPVPSDFPSNDRDRTRRLDHHADRLHPRSS
jgi:hypothetical protein